MDRMKLKKRINRIITLAVVFSFFTSSCLVSYALECQDFEWWTDLEYEIFDDSLKELCVSEGVPVGLMSACGTDSLYYVDRYNQNHKNDEDFVAKDPDEYFAGGLTCYRKGQYKTVSGSYTDTCTKLTVQFDSDGYETVGCIDDYNNTGKGSCFMYVSRSPLEFEVIEWHGMTHTSYDTNNSYSRACGTLDERTVFLNGLNYTIYKLTDGGSSKDYDAVKFYSLPNCKIFDSVEHATAYLYTGDETGLLYKPKEKVIAKPDNTLGFQYVTLRKYYSPYTSGCQNAMFQFALKNDTAERIDGTWKLVVNLSLDYRVRVQNGSKLLTLINGDDVEHGTIDYTYEQSCKNLLSTDGSLLFNLIDMYGDPTERAYLNGSLVPQFTGKYRFNDFCKALKEEEDSAGYFYDILSGSGSSLVGLDPKVNLCLGQVFSDFVDGADTYIYSFDYITLSLDCYLLNKDGTVRSQGGIATLDFNTGQNSGNVSDVSESGDYTPVDGSEHSDRNDYQVSTDGDGNTAIYYYDYSDHSVTNVTNPSSGGSGNVTQNNNVSIPDTINVNINQPDNGLGNVTIEDDDMSLETITRTLKEGFGILDDVDTDKKGDGYPSMLSYLYSFLPSDFSVMPLLGIASLTGLAILERLIFRK